MPHNLFGENFYQSIDVNERKMMSFKIQFKFLIFDNKIKGGESDPTLQINSEIDKENV
jgi:hypothetical protein